MIDSQLVWVRDVNEGYIQGYVSKVGEKEFDVVPMDEKFQKRICSIEEIFPPYNGLQDHDDCCELNFYSILDNGFSGFYSFFSQIRFLRNSHRRSLIFE